MEMNLRLTSVEYVVFDEADRLFEMDGPGGPVEGDPEQAARHQADGPVLCRETGTQNMRAMSLMRIHC